MDARGQRAPEPRRSADEGMMHSKILRAITRRHFFRQSGFGIGGAGAVGAHRRPAVRPARPTDRSRRGRRTSRRRRRTSSICSWPGAPTQLDLFDNKPALQKHDGQEIPAEFIPKGERFAFIKGTPRLLGSPFTFKTYGQSGAELSELLPHLADIADDIAIVRSRSHDAVQPRARSALHEHRQPGVRPARAWARG